MSSNSFQATDSEGINALMEAGVAAAEPFYVNDVDHGLVAAVVTVPTGYVTKTIDLVELRAPHLPAPARKAGLYTVRDVNSFLSYYLKHAETEAETWVTPGEVTAVLNANDGAMNDTGAHWEDHRLVLQLQHSPEWMRWTGKSGRLLPQDVFAEFLEEGAADVVQPDMATVLEVVQSLEATTRVDFESAYRTNDGQRGFKYVETTTARAGQKGDLEIPSCFVLSLRVYEGQDPISVTARFRYRINGDSLQLGIVIDRIPEILEAALANTVTTISEGIDRGMVLVGPAPGDASSSMTTPAPIDYSRDQGAVDWARGEVEKVIAWCLEREWSYRSRGDEEHAMRYRVAANVMKMRLTSDGCVITAFSQRGPVVRRAMDAAP